MTAAKLAEKAPADLAGLAADYLVRLSKTFADYPLAQIESLGAALLDCWKTGKQVFIFGNGGSAGNAVHLDND